MASNNEMLTVLIAGLCLFGFFAFLVVYAQLEGGNWSVIASALTKFIVVIVVFMVAAFAVVALTRRR